MSSEDISWASNSLVGRSLGCDLHEAAFSVGMTMLLSLSPYLLDLQLRQRLYLQCICGKRPADRRDGPSFGWDVRE